MNRKSYTKRTTSAQRHRPHEFGACCKAVDPEAVRHLSSNYPALIRQFANVAASVCGWRVIAIRGNLLIISRTVTCDKLTGCFCPAKCQNVFINTSREALA